MLLLLLLLLLLLRQKVAKHPKIHGRSGTCGQEGCGSEGGRCGGILCGGCENGEEREILASSVVNPSKLYVE